MRNVGPFFIRPPITHIEHHFVKQKNYIKVEWKIKNKQGQRKAWHIPSPKNLTLWPWKSIGFQILLRTNYVPSLVNIHWRMLILECSHGCYAVQNSPGDLDLWPMTLIIERFLILLRTKYVPRLVKIHWRMLILECSQGCYGRTDGRTDGRTVALLYPVATSLVIYE